MKLTKSQRAELKQKYGGCCSYCGVELGTRWQADHLIPVIRTWEFAKNNKGEQVTRTTGMSNPENDTIENMMPACYKCNNDKSSMSLERWREIIPHRVYTLNNDPKYASYQKAKRFGLVVEMDIEIVFWFEKYGKEQNQ